MRRYMPLYYAAAFRDDLATFSQYNALFLCFLGFAASLGGGILSDKLSQGNPDENPWSKIVTVSCLATVPLHAYCFLTQDNFNLSMVCLAL